MFSVRSTLFAVVASLCLSTSVLAIDATGSLPDPTLTPGDVRTTTLLEVCDKSVSTKSIRHVTGFARHHVFDNYTLLSKRDKWCNSERGCELDHLVPLELGGSNDEKNLFPQAYSGTVWNASVKDKLENEVHKRVCAGRLDLVESQKRIATDWIAFYKDVFKDEPLPE
jgi:hypothetical protein